MISIQQAASEFLACKRIAVTGVSRHPGSHGSNAVYRRLRDRGYQVYAVNPNAETVEGDHCFRTLSAIPGGVDAVVIGTRPERAEATMKECEALGIERVWLHRAFGEGSASPVATKYGREHGIHVINGGCPLMFEPASDGGHKFLKFVCRLNGHLPREAN